MQNGTARVWVGCHPGPLYDDTLRTGAAQPIAASPSHQGGTMLNSATVNQPRVDRWFFIVVGLLMIFLNFVAFGPSIIDPSGRRMPLPFTPLVAAHVPVSTAFLFVFVAQATLVATRRTDVHRRLGIIGAL